MTNSLSADSFSSWKHSLQNVDSLAALISRSYSFEVEDHNYSLVPFTGLDTSSDVNCEMLANWRTEHIYAYPTRSEITIVGTARWLERAVLSNNQRILFWIVSSSLERIGHIGIVHNIDSNTLEVDNVLRGTSGRFPGVMTGALLKIESIAEEEFSVNEIFLKVLESNTHAVKFYEKNDYEVLEVEDLTWNALESGQELVPGLPKNDAFLTMKKDLQSQNGHVPDLILTAGPSISPLEISYVMDAVSHGWNSKHSDYLNQFEKEFADYIGVKHAMATSSCTGALHLSLLALGIGPGDEVLVPDITWVATASAIRYVGAKPIFVDINRSTWTLDIDMIERQITSRTKAIIPVHLYGYGALMPELMLIAQKHGLRVVEDAAPAIGTRISSKLAGSYGDFGCFSFQGAKLLVTGEGGMLVTDDSELFAKAKKIQDHGRKPGTFWIEELGHKYKMNNVTAALGLGQIQRSENQILRKRRINSWYRQGLENTPGIEFQEQASGTESICWMTSFTIDTSHKISRDVLIQELKARGIDSRPVFPSISQYPIWGYDAEVPINSKYVGDNGINLPSGVLLSENSVAKVIDKVKEILK